MKEKLKKRKLEREAEDKEIIEQMFRDWLSKCHEKTFDLSKSRDEIFLEFYQKFGKGEFKTLDSLATAIFKSYYFSKPNEMQSFARKSELMLMNKNELINKFFKEKILDDDVKMSISDSDDIWKVYAKVLAEKLPKVLGNVNYVEFSGRGFDYSDKVRREIIQAMKEKGFTHSKIDDNLFFCPEKNVSSDIKVSQKFILDSYIKVVDRYIYKFDRIISKDCSEEDFNVFCESVGKLFSNLEAKMTDETKKSPDFISKNKYVKNFFEEQIPLLRAVYFKDGVKYHASLKAALDKFEKYEDKETFVKEQHDDALLLDAFLNKLKELGSVLTIKDEDGQNYPVNYFVVMTIDADKCSRLITNLQKSGYVSEDEANKLYLIKGVLRNNFSGDKEINPLDLNKDWHNNIFKEFKVKIQRNGKVIDLQNDDNFIMFKNMVIKTIEEYNLPYTRMCVRGVAYNLARGKKAVNLGEYDDGSHKEYEKAFKKYYSVVVKPTKNDEKIK